MTVRSSPWFYRDKAVLLGDAAHAVVPFYGQGANASFEDCVVLDECLRKHGDDLEIAFADYHRRRKVNVDALADLALGNFIEMRDHVASRGFLLKKKLGQTLHRLMPRGYLPMYSMVTFSRIPYAEAVERNRRQNRRLGVAGAAILSLVLILIVLATV